ncbi:MAG: hypothetical protein QM658_12275 [Gordonia sp. (in: high G+C Gram-positive bacteria)]
MGDESLAALVDVVSGAWRRGVMSEQTVEKFSDLADRFVRFAAAHEVIAAADVDPKLCEEFVRAPGRSRTGEPAEPALATMRNRRATLRVLFRTARLHGIGLPDPTTDVGLPLRGGRGAVRTLTGSEVELVYFFADRGATTLCYDGALRGVHLQRLATAGYLVFSPTHSTTAKPHAFEQISGCGCGTVHKLVTVDGSLAVRRVDDHGETVDVRLDIAKLYVLGSPGARRWYQDVVLPCGATHRVRINDTEPNGKARMERLRQAAKHDSDQNAPYNQFYGRREDAESANNIIERVFHGNRAIAMTAAGQFLAMLTSRDRPQRLRRPALATTTTVRNRTAESCLTGTDASQETSDAPSDGTACPRGARDARRSLMPTDRLT